MTTADMSLTPLLHRLRRRAWLQAGLVAIAGALVVAGFTGWTGDLSPVIAGSVAGIIVLAIYRVRHAAFVANESATAEHLNRCVPQLEESAELWLKPVDQLGVLERLQRARVEPAFAQLATETGLWLPPLRWRMPLLISALGLALFWSPAPLMTARSTGESGERSVSPALVTPPALVAITVTPPAYMGAAAFDTDNFNVTLPEGATVTWQMSHSAGTPLRLALNTSEAAELRIDFTQSEQGYWQASAVITETSLYRLEQQGVDGFTALPGVYSLAVTLDRPPRLRVLEPKKNRLEIPREGDPHFVYRVSVTDDYGVGDVEIFASVAKGSGEGVKFRDERFNFESNTVEDGVQIYERHWDLRALGMEPGDEVYLFTRARDNHPRKLQESRSDTLVVRWLDETQIQPVSDGLAISVMPEYFKSQRQIIIETEQLIADQAVLPETVFVQTSRDLGVAQSELKERYGQYLGDEFGESEAPSGLVTEAASDEEGEAEDDDHEGHDHGGAGNEDLPQTAEALIARFGHDHGAAEIGPITRRSPVGLMKRAVANMWDAELQLRLANPEAALPFEYEALKYFDLARQAERIYTQRLGFEPPPVSEERRLTGELDDIESRERAVSADPDPSVPLLMRDLYRLLNERAPGSKLDAEAVALLTEAAAVFTERATERPALIQAAAHLEQMRLSGRLIIEDCADCLLTLQSATWSLLPDIAPAPMKAMRRKPDVLGAEYLQRLDAAAVGGVQ